MAAKIFGGEKDKSTPASGVNRMTPQSIDHAEAIIKNMLKRG